MSTYRIVRSIRVSPKKLQDPQYKYYCNYKGGNFCSRRSIRKFWLCEIHEKESHLEKEFFCVQKHVLFFWVELKEFSTVAEAEAFLLSYTEKPNIVSVWEHEKTTNKLIQVE